ncbi:AAA family ATPase [Asticcacaulis sp. AC402]|uniref:AAA family ATPase n=1 Tax=Asticcacaulis sp. AC402 TaxID=1282361 RepID=UPI0003C3D196|nr:AAA family ATPase [Asticcacaulis sp. AC402]ESQ74084.1 hypothetical protein ABAC402_15645 [Asticcacaulis sp. AC402]
MDDIEREDARAKWPRVKGVVIAGVGELAAECRGHLGPANRGNGSVSAQDKTKALRHRVTTEIINNSSQDTDVSGRLRAYKVLEAPLAVSPPPELKAVADLRDQAPNLAAVLDDLEIDLRFMKRKGVQMAPPRHILLWGASGAGKTWAANRLAGVLSEKAMFHSAAGMSSAIEIVGQPAGFRSADASLAVRAIARSRRANPAIVFDEIDKAGSSDWNGDVRLALLPFTEAESSSHYYDAFTQIHIDCSHVTWIFTANQIEKLPEPLVSRLSVYEIARPGVESLYAVLKGFRQDMARRYGLSLTKIPAIDDILQLRVEKALLRGDSLRDIRSEFEVEIKRRAVANPRRRPQPRPTPMPVT